MKRLFTLFLILATLTGFSQHKIIFDLKSITNSPNETGESDTTNLIIPRKITIIANPLSKIVEITKLKGTSIGVQFEILKSKLQGTEHLISGMVIYKKDSVSQEWSFISRYDHWPVMDLDGRYGYKGLLISSTGLRLSENGTEYDMDFRVFINREPTDLF